MTLVNIAGFLTEFTNGQSQIQLETAPRTVGGALSELWQLHSGLRDRVLNEKGEVRRHVNVFVDDENIRRKEVLETAIDDNTEITILPSVSGGLQD